MPKDEYIQLGYFIILEGSRNHYDYKKLYSSAKVTEDGLLWLLEKNLPQIKILDEAL